MTSDQEEFKCLWCDYSTKGVDSIRSHLCVHLDYFPLQCMVCDHWLPSSLMFNFHCQLKDHPADSQSREFYDQTKEDRIEEMLSQVIREFRVQPSEQKFDEMPNQFDETPNQFDEMSNQFDMESVADTDGGESVSSHRTSESVSLRKVKHVCGKCDRGYVIAGIVKHVWKHIAEEKKMVPFACEGIDCSYATHLTNSALHHHKTVHRRDPQAQIADYRDECGPAFEECLAEWFDLNEEDSDELLKGRYG